MVTTGAQPANAQNSPEGEVFTIRHSMRERVIAWALGAPLAIAIIGGAALLAVYTNPPVFSMAFASALTLAATGLLFAWTLINVGSVLVLTPTHVVYRPPARKPTVIAWNEVIAVQKRRRNVLRIVSTFDERIDISPGFASHDLWDGLHRYLPTQFHTQLIGRPGFAPRPTPSFTQRATALMYILAAIGSRLLINHIDWRTPDVRCVRETVGSLFGPYRSCLERAAADHDADWMAALLAKGADPKRTDRQGETALHESVRLGFPDGARLLLDAGADPFRKDLSGYSALDLAVKARDYESVTVVLQHIKKQGSREVAFDVLRMANSDGDAKFQSLVRTELGSLLPRVADPSVGKRYGNLLKEASADYARRDFGGGVVLANKAIELDPEVGAGYFASGFGYGEMKNWGRAKARLHKALELMPDNIEAMHYLARLFEMTGDADQAEEMYTRAIKLQPQAWSIYLDRAINRADSGRVEAAIEDAAIACSHNAEGACEFEQSLKRQRAG